MLSFIVEGRQQISLIDTIATSTSASTVTGLWFYSSFTLSNLSFFSQVVVLILIQIGGIGAITAAAFLQTILRGKLMLTEQMGLSNLLGRKFFTEVAPLVRTIVIYTLVIELAGFVAFFSRFVRDYPLDKAIFYSLFHSVSCFCNAGFTLYSTSFQQYQTDWFINLVSMCLIILGGLGFIVLVAIRGKVVSFFLRRKSERFDLHSKIVLTSTVFLILAGVLVFFSFDAVHLNLSLEDKILVSFFQSVTSRTAGFNTVNIGDLSAITLFFFTVLMFIGAGPLSTSGGIKVTTFFLSILLVRRVFRRDSRIEIWKHAIPEETLWRGMSLILVSFAILGVLLGVLLVTESFSFESILFEITSAFGTVGLSTGITPFLTDMGKIIITVVMVFGRLGPLTLVYMIARKRDAGEVHLVEDDSVMVG